MNCDVEEKDEDNVEMITARFHEHRIFSPFIEYTLN